MQQALPFFYPAKSRAKNSLETEWLKKKFLQPAFSTMLTNPQGPSDMLPN